ncbi:MAG: hypothetical protein KU37_04220 [Sulfuricurvum sp. PC08-66]|nr:MAG: hypothetical protein KU37_04220 [Sulfuricurvum sp. PC08-66]
MAKRRLLFAASEVFPFAKTGGLADVAMGLPKALQAHFEVTIVLPLYASVDRAHWHIQEGESLHLRMNGLERSFTWHSTIYEGIEVLFVHEAALCDRPHLYGEPSHDYEDNAVRFGLFDHAIVARLEQGGFDVVVCSDWQTGLVPLLLQERASSIPSLFMVHNLAYQGNFPLSQAHDVGIGAGYLNADGIEFWGRMSYLKAGILTATHVVTVSQRYAQEILTPHFGAGLEGFLAHHAHKIEGIQNGIDTVEYPRQSDKKSAKIEWMARLGCKNPQLPLVVFIARFAHQKGLDMLIEALPRMLQTPCAIAILGEGDMRYAQALEALAPQFPTLFVQVGFNEKLSRALYSVADFLLMPSLFEPCGLNQLIAMHHGALPIVHGVGGLIDSVQEVTHFDATLPKGVGVVFDTPTADALVAAHERAMTLYNDRVFYERLSMHNLSLDFSWKQSAKRYQKLLDRLIKEAHRG